ncbi:hypothetical protein BH11MYX4_BH11MYX4_29340 [soil metagenome]
MSDHPIAALPAEIEQLLALERDAYGDELDLKSAVLSHVELTVGLRGPSGGGDGGSGEGSPPAGGGAGGGGGGLLGAAGKVLGAVGAGAFVVGVVVGGLGSRALTPALVAAPVATSVAIPPRPAPLAEPMAEDASDIVPTPRVVPSADAPPKPLDAPRAGNDLVREREVIDAARAALTHGRPADALTATARHAERWPRGHLAEEREVIAIQALAASGRRAEADRRASAFKRSFPASMLIPAVDQALSTP